MPSELKFTPARKSRVWVCGPTKDGVVTGAGRVVTVIPNDDLCDEGEPDQLSFVVAVDGREPLYVFTKEYLHPIRG
jgi:hypothetical protein